MFFDVYSSLTVAGSDARVPSCMCPKAWSLGRTLFWTVLSSSTQPTRCSSLGTQSLNPAGRSASKRHPPSSSTRSTPPCLFPALSGRNPLWARRKEIIHKATKSDGVRLADSPSGGPWVMRMSMPSGMRFHLSSRDCPRGRLKPQPLNQGDLRHRPAW